MPKHDKVNACLTVLLAVLFYLFFQIPKHNPALSHVNAFAEDPYDAIGSFCIQLALFTAFISLLRAFRPYQRKQMLNNQKLFFVRGAYFSCLSIAVTLAADGVAMLRYPSVWIGEPTGFLLAAWLGGMALLTVLVGWLIHRSMPDRRSPSAHLAWIRAIGISMVSILILAFYPESWRQSVPGAILTILVGEILLIVPVWALGIALSPFPETSSSEDIIDDLVSVYRWLKAHAGPFVVVCRLFEKILGWSFVRLVLRWLNPRRHPWNLIILMGVAMGMLIAEIEGLSEGGGSSRLMLIVTVTAITVGVESSGVLLGYIFLAKPIGLFRSDSDDKR
jgi:hypothetical protein